MNKSKTSMGKIWKYLREVSVVVIGVAVTLSVSYWISNRNEKRDVALYLDAIKLELEENIKHLDEEADYLEDWEKYAVYLQSHDKKSLHPDSIRMGGASSGLGITKDIIFQTSAFEMFKVSGTMRLINNKALLQSLWKSYLLLELIRERINAYYDLKTEQCKKENQLILEEKPVSIPLYDFFVTYTNFGALEGCRELSKDLKETITKLEKK